MLKRRAKGTVEMEVSLESPIPVHHHEELATWQRHHSLSSRAMASKFKDQGYTLFGCSQRSQSSASIDRSGGGGGGSSFRPPSQLFFRQEED